MTHAPTKQTTTRKLNPTERRRKGKGNLAIHWIYIPFQWNGISHNWTTPVTVHLAPVSEHRQRLESISVSKFLYLLLSYFLLLPLLISVRRWRMSSWSVDPYPQGPPVLRKCENASFHFTHRADLAKPHRRVKLFQETLKFNSLRRAVSFLGPRGYILICFKLEIKTHSFW